MTVRVDTEKYTDANDLPTATSVGTGRRRATTAVSTRSWSVQNRRLWHFPFDSNGI